MHIYWLWRYRYTNETPAASLLIRWVSENAICKKAAGVSIVWRDTWKKKKVQMRRLRLPYWFDECLKMQSVRKPQASQLCEEIHEEKKKGTNETPAASLLSRWVSENAISKKAAGVSIVWRDTWRKAACDEDDYMDWARSHTKAIRM